MSPTRLSVALLISAIATLSAISSARPLYDLAPVTAEVQRQVDVYQLPGATLRLAKSGNLVYQDYFGSYDANTRIPIASASKWLSALAIARLVEKKEMSWDDTVGSYFPDAPVDKRDITLRELLSHTSGLPGATDALCLSERSVTLDACAQQILQMTLVGAPGTVFSYGGNSMQVAGRMAEIASGKSWDQLFVDEMVTPLGLTATDYATESQKPGYVATSNPRIAGGVRSTIDDYGRVVDMVAAEGLVGDTEFLSPDTLAYMELKHSAGTVILNTPYPTSLGYGIGQWREAENSQGVATRVSSPGAYGAYPFVDHMQDVAGFYLVSGQYSQMGNDEIALEGLCLRQLNFTRTILPPPPPRLNGFHGTAPTGSDGGSHSSMQ